ncbi:MAG: hypothetical protein LUH15_09910 [Tannerellaceae bacterium]|nr:hypothetical protein [Tannerellaceae bacterium]
METQLLDHPQLTICEAVEKEGFISEENKALLYKAAKEGSAEVQHFLGNIFDNGLYGQAIDKEEALK